MFRVGAYGRVSTNRREQDTSLENQISMFDSYIASQKWELTDLYIDRKSGTKAKRPELLRLIEDINLKKIDVILVKDLSRLARNGELSYKIANLAREKGVHIISLDGMVNTLENNAEMFGLLAWMYQKESESLSQRIKSIKQLGAKQGKYQGSTPPYGYRLQSGKLIIRDENTTNIVKRIFQEYIEGKGPDTIAKYLTLEAVPTPAQVANRKNAGVEWAGSTIRTILTNPHYSGNLVQGRTATVSVVSTKRKDIPKEEQIEVGDTHNEIISEATFKTVQRLMKQREMNHTAPQLNLFTNVVFCADCGKGMWNRAGRKGYICGTSGRYGVSKCPSHFVKEKTLIDTIKDDFEKFLQYLNLDILSKQFQGKVEKALNKSNRDLEKIEGKIQVLLNRKIVYAQMIADGDMDMETFKITNNANGMEIEKLRVQKEFLQENVSKDEVNLFSIKDDFMLYLYSPKVLPEVIHRFISRIEIEEDGTPRIYYNFKEPMNVAAS